MSSYMNPEDISFKSCEVLELEKLGTGAYGSVYRAKLDDLLCAAKVMHPTLVLAYAEHQVTPQSAHHLPIRRFEAECRMLSAIRHPNIVQYLGTWQNRAMNLPMLLMELMDESLTAFLDKCETLLPFHVQVSICHDIALALSFLHSNGIIHRDLSSNNILLIRNIRAKITDFGMARMFNHGDTTLSKNPGTDAYMPPEALSDDPQYDDKIDCFSFGVLVIQILTLLFPKPTNNYIPVSNSILHKKVPEVERRKNHIELIAPDHALLPVALESIRDPDEEAVRPSSQELCKRVAELRKLPQFVESERISDPKFIIGEKEKEIKELRRRMEEERCQHKEEIESLNSRHNAEIEDIKTKGDQAIHQLHEKNKQFMKQIYKQHMEEVNQLKEKIKIGEDNLQFQEHDHNHDIMKQKEEYTLHLTAVEEEKEELRMRLKINEYDLRDKDDQLQRLKRKVQDLEENCVEKNGEKSAVQNGDVKKKPPGFLLNWKIRDEPAPHRMYREDSESVCYKDTVFIRPASTRSVYAYNPIHEVWEEMPKCVHKYSTLTQFNNQILAIGGRTDALCYFNSIYRLTADSEGKRAWEEADFSMPIKRCSVIAVSTDTLLILAGGRGEESNLRRIDVMDSSTNTWYRALDLPEALYFSSASLSGEKIYFLGGHMGYNSVERNLMFSCSIDDLRKSFTSNRTRRRRSSSEAPANMWKTVAGPPTTRSACICFHDQILAIGGKGLDGKATSAVYGYNEHTNSWSTVSYMTTTRSQCFAITLSDEQILVVGGVTAHFGTTNTIEVGQFLAVDDFVLL